MLASVPVHVQVPDVVQQAAMLLAVPREVRDLVLLHQPLLGGEVECGVADQVVQVWPGWRRCRRASFSAADSRSISSARCMC